MHRLASEANATSRADRSTSTTAGTAFALHHRVSRFGDLLSPEFSPDRTGAVPLPPRSEPGPAPDLGPGPARSKRRKPPSMGRVIPLRPGQAGWALPLAEGRPLALVPGHGRHHRPEPRRHLSLEEYSHRFPKRIPIVAATKNSSSADTSGSAPPPTPPAKPSQRLRAPWRASRVRTYVSHPGRDMAPLSLAVRAYLERKVK